jgi:acetyltransferase-like isoleucine patch superfamily enzyme
MAFAAGLRRKLAGLRFALRFRKWPAWVGGCSLLWNRLLHPDLHVGPGARARGRFTVVMQGEGEIRLGRKVRLISDPKRSNLGIRSPIKLMTFPGARILVGDRVLMAGTIIVARKRIEIGDDTMISPDVFIVDSDFHTLWPPEQRFDLAPIEEARPVKIGRRAWIGLGAVILKGVTIGDGAVIGAGAVVTSDVPAGAMAAGVPARVLRRLDEPRAPSTPATGEPPR